MMQKVALSVTITKHSNINNKKVRSSWLGWGMVFWYEYVHIDIQYHRIQMYLKQETAAIATSESLLYLVLNLSVQTGKLLNKYWSNSLFNSFFPFRLQMDLLSLLLRDKREKLPYKSYQQGSGETTAVTISPEGESHCRRLCVKVTFFPLRR